MWHLTKQQQDIVERRMGSLVGIPNWIPPANTDIFKHTGRLKSVDWQRLTKGPGAYVFEGMLPPAQQTALEAMLESLAACQRMVYDLADDKSNIRTLQELQRKETKEMIERVCIFEKAVPMTVMHVQLHQLIHVPKCAFKWNQVRNFWAFANERSEFLLCV